jgi:hypothetical protein
LKFRANTYTVTIRILKFMANTYTVTIRILKFMANTYTFTICKLTVEVLLSGDRYFSISLNGRTSEDFEFKTTFRSS